MEGQPNFNSLSDAELLRLATAESLDGISTGALLRELARRRMVTALENNQTGVYDAQDGTPDAPEHKDEQRIVRGND